MINDIKNEVWKDIPNYVGFYQASNLGRIKSLNRNIEYPCGKKNPLKGKILSQNINGTGYFVVGLYKNGKAQTLKVSQLVAMAFLNHTPNGFKDFIVDHIDRNVLNNKLDNLQVITQRQNVSRANVKRTSNLTGVCWHKGNQKWTATIYIEGKTKHLGYFKDEIKAHNKYKEALAKLIK